MRPFFVQRGYPTYLLDTAIQKTSCVRCSDALQPRLEQILSHKMPLVLTFHPFSYKVSSPRPQTQFIRIAGHFFLLSYPLLTRALS